MGKYGKIWENMGKYGNVWERMGKYMKKWWWTTAGCPILRQIHRGQNTPMLASWVLKLRHLARTCDVCSIATRTAFWLFNSLSSFFFSETHIMRRNNQLRNPTNDKQDSSYPFEGFPSEISGLYRARLIRVHSGSCMVLPPRAAFHLSKCQLLPAVDLIPLNTSYMVEHVETFLLSRKCLNVPFCHRCRWRIGSNWRGTWSDWNFNGPKKKDLTIQWI